MAAKRRRIMQATALAAIMQIHVEDAADGVKRRRVTHANTRTLSSPVPKNVHTPNVDSRATATAVKASNDATRCAATRREVNVHTSSTSSMTSTGVQVQATVVEATAGAHTSSAVADTGGKKVKRRRRQRKNDTTPSHVVMVITDETVEERKQRLSDEADRADKLARVQAEDQAKERIPDDEETEDEDVFKEQQLLRQAQAKRDAKVVDRLARLKIDRYKLVGEDKLLVKQCIFKSAKSKQPTVAWPAVVPQSMIPTILSLFHGDKSILRHAGKHKTYGAMRNRFVWKGGMTQAVRQWVSACHKCLLRKRQVTLQTKYNIQPEAEAPMKRICIDIVGPLVRTRTVSYTH